MVTHDPDLANRAQRNIHLIDGCVAVEDNLHVIEQASQIAQAHVREPLTAQI